MPDSSPSEKGKTKQWGSEKPDPSPLLHGINLQVYTIDVPDNWSEGDFEFDKDFEAEFGIGNGVEADDGDQSGS